MQHVCERRCGLVSHPAASWGSNPLGKQPLLQVSETHLDLEAEFNCVSTQTITGIDLMSGKMDLFSENCG